MSSETKKKSILLICRGFFSPPSKLSQSGIAYESNIDQIVARHDTF